jgi:hypothetical protein
VCGPINVELCFTYCFSFPCSPDRQASCSLPYWQQGDAELETPEQKAKRDALREHPLINAVLEVWWETAQVSRP